MNVAQIKMSAAKARKRFDEYTEALASREATAEDTAALLGYKALADGKDVLDLFQVFRDTPADAQGRPRLAVARAHWSHVAVRRESDGRATWVQLERFAGWGDFYGRLAWHRRIRFPVETLHASARPGRAGSGGDLSAIVPTIPPPVRPPRALHRYVVLWEADWQVAPVDPLLLRHLAGPLYVVLASWDLTELERSILAARE
jgi:hypothetical protein